MPTSLNLSLNPVTFQDALLRITLALFAGLVVGMEREHHGRVAGLRTTILACVSSAVAMVLSESLFAAASHNATSFRPDPARLAAGILTGMGFLGGGAILKHGNLVQGVTTAAVLWFVTILGLAFGSGYIFLGLLGMGVMLITLFLIPPLETSLFKIAYGTVTITAELDSTTDDEIRSNIERHGVKVIKMEMEHDFDQKRRVLCCAVRFHKHDEFDISRKVLGHLQNIPGTQKVKWNS